MDRQGYQYVITGLNPEESYDVKVKVRIIITKQDKCTSDFGYASYVPL